MIKILPFVAAAVVQGSSLLLIWHKAVKQKTSPHIFALIFTGGFVLSVVIMLMFIIDFTNVEMVTFFALASLINFICGYPVSYYAHKLFLEKRFYKIRNRAHTKVENTG